MYRANINDFARVKLTAYGRRLHRAHHDTMVKAFPGYAGSADLIEDEEGFSRWQIWHLMLVFGQYMGTGAPLCFETEFFIEQGN